MLPPDRRVDRSKIEDYLLHPVKSRGKAAFFQAFGFTLEQWQELRDALLEHAAAGHPTEAVVSLWGTRYSVRGELRTPGGRQPPPVVTSVWQSESGTSGVRLITAYPG